MLRIAAVLLLLSASGVAAQSRDQTLADIRQELTMLHVEMQRLKRELSTTGTPEPTAANAGMLERVDALDGDIRRLTARTEELEHRVGRIVEDGTRRIGDLEFRLVELEGGDVSQLGETTTLGGADTDTAALDVGGSGTGTGAGSDTGADTGEMAMGEQADFDAALADLENRDYAVAARKFSAVIENYPGGPLTGEANFHLGVALSAQDIWRPAARAYLEAFSGAPNGQRAPEALYMLGVSLDRIGQREEACLTLNEVPSRFPDAEFAVRARDEMFTLGCN